MSVVRRWLARAAVAVVVVSGVLVPAGGAQVASGATLPAGFREQVVFSGLDKPTNLEFAPDGRIFVAEKSGIIKVFDSLTDSQPTVFADLSRSVFGWGDRGLLGLALAPHFPTDPYVYVLYTKDAAIGATAPKWNDNCTSPGGITGGGCIVSGQLSRLTADGDLMVPGSEKKLVEGWCQQFSSHSIGELRFGPDGALYATGGDGASWSASADYGQIALNGNPANPCGDPAREGGALRAQDLRTNSGGGSGDPVGLSGALLRLDPATGAAMVGNPNSGSADANAKRVVAYGLRNPYRFAFRPGAAKPEAWIYDTGMNNYEEIDRAVNPAAGVTNFGWPCYEGAPKHAGYDAANLPICESLYSGGGASAPYFSYKHSDKVVAGEACPSGGSATGGIAFFPSRSSYPATYSGAVFFADYARRCVWTMAPGTDGVPSAAKVTTFASDLATPVDLEFGPGGELYYVDHAGGTVRRFRHYDGNQPPIAQFSATPTAGKTPLTVAFDASSTTDPDLKAGEQLTYEWDFTNDGSVDATGAKVSHVYGTTGTFTAKLTARDSSGADESATTVIRSGQNLPTATITTPTVTTTWATNEKINFSGGATDDNGAALGADKLTWELVLLHCYENGSCHEHSLQQFAGVAAGSFPAPDHEYPSYLELRLTATGAHGTSTSAVRLSPRTVKLTFTSSPSGLPLTVGAQTDVTPFTRTMIVGSTGTVSAPTLQSLPTGTYYLRKWSDGGAQTHEIVAPAGATTIGATYLKCTAVGGKRICSGSAARGPR